MNPTNQRWLAACFALGIAGCGDLKKSVQAKPESVPVPKSDPIVPWEKTALTKPMSPAKAAASPQISTSFKPHAGALVDSESQLERKVMTTRERLRGVDPTTGHETGPAARYFWPYFVFEYKPVSSEPTFVRVGPKPTDTGDTFWLRVNDTAEWSTRIAKRYRSNRPVFVFTTKAGLVHYLETGGFKEQPIAKAHPGEQWMPWPTVASEQIAIDGLLHEIVQLQFLGSFRTAGASPSATAYTPAERSALRNSIRTIEVVFVVDNTLSTTPYLAAIKQLVIEIARKLDQLPGRPTLRLSLVLYRDYVDEILFDDGSAKSVTKSFPLTNNLGEFLSQIQPLKAAEDSSIDSPEAGFDGLQAGLAQWTKEEPSHRALVWVGDNSAHPPTSPKNPKKISPEAIIAEAKRKHVNIQSVCIVGSGGDDEQALHKSQCEAMRRATGGVNRMLANDQAQTVAQEIVAKISDLLKADSKAVRDRATVFDKLLEGKSTQEILRETDLDVRRLNNVMEFLNKTGVDADKLKPGAVTFASGWTAAESKGERVLDTVVYVTRSEIDQLIAELTDLMRRTQADFPRSLFVGQVGFKTGAGDNFLSQRREETMSVFLMKQRIPCPNGILMLTQSQIEHMSEADRARLHERVSRNVVPALMNFRNDARNFAMFDKLGVGWINVELLP